MEEIKVPKFVLENIENTLRLWLTHIIVMIEVLASIGIQLEALMQ